MPGSTPTYGLRYLELGDAPNIAKVGKDLAEDVEGELARVDADTTSLDTRVDTLETSGRRIGRNVRTTSSGTVTTTETQVQTVTATLVAGVRYQITWQTRVISTVAVDVSRLQIREDNVAGTVLQKAEPAFFAASRQVDLVLIAEYVAVSSASKTFSMTLQRALGTGLHSLFSDGATHPIQAFIDEVR